jgi:hypothetical protein
MHNTTSGRHWGGTIQLAHQNCRSELRHCLLWMVPTTP